MDSKSILIDMRDSGMFSSGLELDTYLKQVQRRVLIFHGRLLNIHDYDVTVEQLAELGVLEQFGTTPIHVQA